MKNIYGKRKAHEKREGCLQIGHHKRPEPLSLQISQLRASMGGRGQDTCLAIAEKFQNGMSSRN